MKQEERDLLIKDLCARLPYGVKGINQYGKIIELDHPTDYSPYMSIKNAVLKYGWRPYLFPLSSMTKEQKNECFNGTPLEIDKYGDIAVKDDFFGNSMYTDLEIYLEVIDWLLKNHFDIYGLIKKDLAIDCSYLNIY